MKVGSLFSGIGGLDLGLERAGMTVTWQSEIDPYCAQVLAKHWPDVPNLGDVTKVDWSEAEPVDLICGGFPCQPVSLAGRRAGQDDERWLWPEFARCVRALRPRYVVVENVPGLLVRGMGDVLGDLAACGYDTEWDCIPAAAVGAPHLRYRVFIVAHAASRGDGTEIVGAETRGADTGRPASRAGRSGNGSGARTVADTDSQGSQGHGRPVERTGERATAASGAARGTGNMADTDASGRDGRTGVFGQGRRGQLADSRWWAVEPDVRRVAHGIPRRVERLRALGNAVVPQVAEWIGRRIVETAQPEDSDSSRLA